jgi:hypothetical protein
MIGVPFLLSGSELAIGAQPASRPAIPLAVPLTKVETHWLSSDTLAGLTGEALSVTATARPMRVSAPVTKTTRVSILSMCRSTALGRFAKQECCD